MLGHLVQNTVSPILPKSNFLHKNSCFESVCLKILDQLKRTPPAYLKILNLRYQDEGQVFRNGHWQWFAFCQVELNGLNLLVCNLLRVWGSVQAPFKVRSCMWNASFQILFSDHFLCFAFSTSAAKKENSKDRKIINVFWVTFEILIIMRNLTRSKQDRSKVVNFTTLGCTARLMIFAYWYFQKFCWQIISICSSQKNHNKISSKLGDCSQKSFDIFHSSTTLKNS